MKKILLIILFVAVLVGGNLFAQQAVFAQALGGKILYFGGSPGGPPECVPPAIGLSCNRHWIGPPTPSIFPGVICPLCMGLAGIGRWFLGFSAGGIITIGVLGGL